MQCLHLLVRCQTHNCTGPLLVLDDFCLVRLKHRRSVISACTWAAATGWGSWACWACRCAAAVAPRLMGGVSWTEHASCLLAPALLQLQSHDLSQRGHLIHPSHPCSSLLGLLLRAARQRWPAWRLWRASRCWCWPPPSCTSTYCCTPPPHTGGTGEAGLWGTCSACEAGGTVGQGMGTSVGAAMTVVAARLLA